MDILNTKLTRKEFLMYLGSLILGILGISSFLKLISNFNPKSNNQNTRAFGSGPYGI